MDSAPERRSPVPPRLTFFCELGAAALTALFADGSVVDTLRTLSAGVSLGLVDLSDERAEVVRQLNQAGVPVIAWQLLPEDEGYWFNQHNAAFAAARYDTFRAWSARHGLIWNGIGIDVEPDMREIQRALANRWTLLPTVARRLVRPETLRRANRDYAALVTRMRADGYRVDSYIIKMILDERAVGSTLLQRVTGLVDAPADREIPMLYTSFFAGRSTALLWSYGADAQAIAVGSTGGGVSVAGIDQVEPLSWDELSRDLRLAHRLTNDVHIFSLEGCVRQGYLERLKDFDWSASVAIPEAEAAKVNRIRLATRALLWALARPIPTLALIVLAYVAARRRIQR
jgi:hypothetical protein